MYKVIPKLYIIILCLKKKTQHHTALFAMSQSLLAHVFPFVLMFSSDLGVSSVQRPLLVKCILLVKFYS